eukprot:3538341-Prorocentrum_lima.AAC.1
MSDRGEPYAMWDSGASQFLLPLCHLPKNATGTSKAVVRLAVAPAGAIYWHEEVPCKECRTPLIAANK